ncbi:hypothetical protein [Spiroplasma apis]|uniref:Uncharacterized protein n=1 Tax=Spiroplasma apis B31 TaxID=1276258 RepID=V5RKF6_SPIAP|nr:hypothetical protein [Spiroplasma apis]AHB36581.1 hypothetical protein SAPIS_v1c07360 [Spiroplasma apis B31]
MKESNKTFKFKNNFKVFFDFYKLSLKTFFVSPLNILLGIVIIFFVLWIWLLYRENDPFILSSAIGSLIIRNGLHTFYRGLNSHKETGFTKRIDYTPINVWIKPFAYILSSLTINVIVSIALLSSTLIVFDTQMELVKHVNWPMFISGAFFLWLLSVLMSYSIYTFFKRSSMALILALLLYILAYYLLGCAYPYNIIAKYDWLNSFLYAFPQRYMMNVMQAGWVGATNLVFTDIENAGEFAVDWKLTQNLWVPYLATFGFILLFSILLIMVIIIKVEKHKKDKFGVSLILRLSTKYINDLKRCASLEELKTLRKKHLEEIGYRSDTKDWSKVTFKKKK